MTMLRRALSLAFSPFACYAPYIEEKKAHIISLTWRESFYGAAERLCYGCFSGGFSGGTLFLLQFFTEKE